MKFMAKVIGFSIFNVIITFIMIVYHFINLYLYPALRLASNATDVYAQTNPHFINLETVGWMFLLICIVSSIIYLAVSAHSDEYETYKGGRFNF